MPGVMTLLMTSGTTGNNMSTRGPSVTNPSTGQGLLNWGGQQPPAECLIIPLTRVINDATFRMFIVGNEPVAVAGSTPHCWLPVTYGEVLCTGSTTVGSSNSTIVPTTLDRLCDTFALTAGSSDIVRVVSPTSDRIGHVRISLQGIDAEYVEVVFDSSEKTNALYRRC